MTTLYTFGDSILDCGHYNEHGVTPGGLIVRNDDALFPEFRGRDLASRGPARLDHRATDGARIDDLPRQVRSLAADSPGLALVTIGGNDLLSGLLLDVGRGLDRFRAQLLGFVERLPIRPVFLGNVYDPTFGDDARNFLPIPTTLARSAHALVNRAIAEVAAQTSSTLVDLHTHFLRGEPSWLVHTIEPSLVGASEVRRCLLEAILKD